MNLEKKEPYYQNYIVRGTMDTKYYSEIEGQLIVFYGKGYDTFYDYRHFIWFVFFLLGHALEPNPFLKEVPFFPHLNFFLHFYPICQ